MRDYTAYFCGQWIPFSQAKIDPLEMERIRNQGADIAIRGATRRHA